MTKIRMRKTTFVFLRTLVIRIFSDFWFRFSDFPYSGSLLLLMLHLLIWVDMAHASGLICGNRQ